MEITKDQYEFALNRIEELLPLVTDETPSDDKNAVELTLVSDVVEAYEKEYYPISKPTIGQLIGFYMEKLGMSKKELAMSIGVSQSRVSDYISGRAEPTLKIARVLCKNLGMTPAEVLGV